MKKKTRVKRPARGAPAATDGCYDESDESYFPAPVKNPRAEVSRNVLMTDGKTAIQFSDTQDFHEALRESEKAVIYISPVFVSVRDAVILFGKYREPYFRNERLKRAVGELRGALRTFASAFMPSLRERS